MALSDRKKAIRPVCFEATGGGDWALGCAFSTDVVTRAEIGGAGALNDFMTLNGGNTVITVWDSAGSLPVPTYQFDYVILKFDVLQ